MGMKDVALNIERYLYTIDPVAYDEDFSITSCSREQQAELVRQYEAADVAEAC